MKYRLFLKREALFVLTGLAIAGGAASRLPASANTTVTPKPFATAAYASSVSGSFVLGADNLDASNPFNDYGVEGKVDNDVGGVGVLGYGKQSKAYGVYGVTFGTNGIGVYGAGDGPTPAPSSTPNSQAESTGVVGDSHAGDGVFGSTEWSTPSDGLLNPVAGVMGVDNSISGFNNDGVFGSTTSGDFGVAGSAGTNAIAGVGGSGTSSFGVEGISQTGSGVFGMSNATTMNRAAIYGQGGLVSIEAIASTALASSNISYPLIAYSSDGTDLFDVQNTGNVDVQGDLFVHGKMSSNLRSSAAHVAVRVYDAAESRPTIEDTGEGRVIDGVGYVRLDPAFAAGIDDRTPYKVFVTAEGDSKGFYVTAKTLHCFTVRENQSGRSSFDFDYRIVATQYGEGDRRATLVRDDVPGALPRRPTSPSERAKQVAFERSALSHSTRLVAAPRANLNVERRSQ